VAILWDRLGEAGLWSGNEVFHWNAEAAWRVPMLASHFLLFPLAIVVGWSGTRLTHYIRHATNSRGQVLFMLILCWSPLVLYLLALLLNLSGSNP
jgi:hypothetical protein